MPPRSCWSTTSGASPSTDAWTRIEDPHDLKRADDGSWLIVSSAENTLNRVDRQGSPEIVWQPSTVQDSWHPNSVEVVDGELWVTAFGRFEASRGWAGDQGFGAGFLRNLTTGQEFGGLSQPHCPRLVAGQWWVCNSLERSLVRWDERTESWEHRVGLEGYPRGFAVAGDTMFVGESADRDDPDGRAALVIIQGGSITDRIVLPCASIYDVVLAPMAAMEGLRRGVRHESTAGGGRSTEPADDRGRRARHPRRRRLAAQTGRHGHPNPV
jgi:hypothetical protein